MPAHSPAAGPFADSFPDGISATADRHFLVWGTHLGSVRQLSPGKGAEGRDHLKSHVLSTALVLVLRGGEL